jgi:hypothetical protein
MILSFSIHPCSVILYYTNTYIYLKLGTTPLDAATQKGHNEVCRWLQSVGAKDGKDEEVKKQNNQNQSVIPEVS